MIETPLKFGETKETVGAVVSSVVSVVSVSAQVSVSVPGTHRVMVRLLLSVFVSMEKGDSPYKPTSGFSPENNRSWWSYSPVNRKAKIFICVLQVKEWVQSSGISRVTSLLTGSVPVTGTANPCGKLPSYIQ